MNAPVVRKSNELIEARYKLSLGEQRLMLLLISQISPDDEDFKDYQIRVEDFARLFNLESDKSIYEKVESAAESLIDKKIRLQDNEVKEITTWLSYVKYRTGSGLIELRFDKSLKPYLLQLKSHFTQYQLKSVIHFKSQYSIRLYELLKAEEFKNKGGKFNRELSILDYKSYLGLAIDEYVDFDNFRRRVIEPSVKEVSKSSDLIVNFTFQRSGRKISHIIFHVEQNKQTRLDLETGSPTINEKPSMDSAIELTELGVSEITALELLKKYGEGQVQRNIEYFKSFRKTGAQIKNPTGYLVTAIEKDYAAAQMTMEDSKRAKRDTVAKTKAQLEEKKKQEEQKALEEVLKALDTFDTRPEMERKDIIEEYRQTMNAIVLRGFDKWGYRHASQRAAFVKFLDKYNKT